MGKKLAIKGHPTRGKEVIELLEMMGGINSNEAYGNLPNNWDVSYYIFKDDIISVSEDKILIKKQFEIFTLEEFLEKYPYKIGDKIPDVWGNSCTVKSMSWDENYKTVMYGFEETVFVVRGDELWAANVANNTYRKTENNMTESLNDVHSISECKTIGQGTYAIKIADGYKFDSIDENGNIIVKSIKPIYPKTIEECVKLLGVDFRLDMDSYKRKLMANFYRLILCRNAYWKIAGEEMGLSKPWEPDWTNLDQLKYCIWVDVGELITMINVRGQHILAFPTAEMRDTFFKNFKDLIEQCKELL